MFFESIIRIIRPRHWIKNTLLFAPLFFSFQFSFSSIVRVVLAAIVFSFVASSIYIINDIFDKKFDQLHPEKRYRPIASGSISIHAASMLALLLLSIAGIGSAMLSLPLFSILFGYVAINFLYSFFLKKILILDVMVIAIGFVLRILAGSVVVDIPASHWILLCTFFVSLFLGFSKRKNEIDVMQMESQNHRLVLAQYTPDFLRQLLGITAGMSIISYTLYTIDPATITRLDTQYLLYTVPFVVYGIFHYFHLIYNAASTGDPTKIFMNDRRMLMNMFLWTVTFVGLVYYT